MYGSRDGSEYMAGVTRMQGIESGADIRSLRNEFNQRRARVLAGWRTAMSQPARTRARRWAPLVALNSQRPLVCPTLALLLARRHVCVRIEAREIKRVDILHPPPDVGGQLLGAQFPIPLPIAETARKRFELVRVLYWKN